MKSHLLLKLSLAVFAVLLALAQAPSAMAGTDEQPDSTSSASTDDGGC